MELIVKKAWNFQVGIFFLNRFFGVFSFCEIILFKKKLLKTTLCEKSNKNKSKNINKPSITFLLVKNINNIVLLVKKNNNENMIQNSIKT